MVTYLAGGGAEGLPVKLRTRLEPKHVSFEDYERFRFDQGALKEGVVRRYGPETRRKKRSSHTSFCWKGAAPNGRS
jgi:hypothetical protein